MRMSDGDKLIKEYRRNERLLRLEESRRVKSTAYFELLKSVEPVRRAAEYYRSKYKNTYSGEEFDPIGAYESYIRYCELCSSRKKDEAPKKKEWKNYRWRFMSRVKRYKNG